MTSRVAVAMVAVFCASCAQSEADTTLSAQGLKVEVPEDRISRLGAKWWNRNSLETAIIYFAKPQISAENISFWKVSEICSVIRSDELVNHACSSDWQQNYFSDPAKLKTPNFDEKWLVMALDTNHFLGGCTPTQDKPKQPNWCTLYVRLNEKIIGRVHVQGDHIFDVPKLVRSLHIEGVTHPDFGQ